MRIDPESGVIELTNELVLRPRMTREGIMALNVEWEDWVVFDGIPRAFRTIVKLPNKGISPKTIVIVYVGLENRPLAFWHIAAWDLVEGPQSRPEGKYTKRMRAWFTEMFGVKLPLKRDWGHIDATYDPWNQTAGIVCNYRERFSSDEEWSKYKKENRY